MTGTQLAALIRFYTKTDTNTFTDSDMLPIVNTVKDDIASQVTKRNEEYFIIPQTQDLVTSSVTAREYALPDDLMNDLQTVEVALDTTQSTDFVPVLPFHGGMPRLARMLNGITESKITQYFNNQEPRYVLTRRGIYLLSGTISPLSGGLRIRSRQWPADLANLSGSSDLSSDPTTTSFGFPRQFHELWARRTSIVWKSERPQPIPLSALEQQYPADLQSKLDDISHDDDQAEVIGDLPEEDSMSVLGANV